MTTAATLTGATRTTGTEFETIKCSQELPLKSKIPSKDLSSSSSCSPVASAIPAHQTNLPAEHFSKDQSSLRCELSAENDNASANFRDSTAFKTPARSHGQDNSRSAVNLSYSLSKTLSAHHVTPLESTCVTTASHGSIHDTDDGIVCILQEGRCQDDATFNVGESPFQPTAVDDEDDLKFEQHQEQYTRESPQTSTSGVSVSSSVGRGLVSRRGRFVSPARRSSNSLASNAPSSASVSQFLVNKANINANENFTSSRRPLRRENSNEHEDEADLNQSSTNTGRKVSRFSILENNANCRAEETPDLSMSTAKSPSTLSSHITIPNSATSLHLEENRMISSLNTHNNNNCNDMEPPKSPYPSDDFGSVLNSPGSEAIVFPVVTEEKKSDSEHSDDSSFKPSSPVREQHDYDEKDQYLATPTNFALDYGKTGNIPSSFDQSNILAWLHSPSANMLFSPGFGSIITTPRNNNNLPYFSGPGLAPRTPRTPTISTSFFFSDAANLPRSSNATNEQLSNATTPGGSKRNGIICISPLASVKSRCASWRNFTLSTPLNGPSNFFKDVFASPSSMPFLLNDTPRRGDTDGSSFSQSDSQSQVAHRSGTKEAPSLDAVVHLAAERELFADEDLSVLLHMATNTPRAATSDATCGTVFRSPCRDEVLDSNTGDLQLPVIDDSKSGATCLQQKRSKEDFRPPHLEMRTSSSSSKEVLVGGGNRKKRTNKSIGCKVGSDNSVSQNDKSKVTTIGQGAVCSLSSGRSGPDMPSYYGVHPNLPPGIPPGAGGSMRVVVGAPHPGHGSTAGKRGSPSQLSGTNSPHIPHPPYNEYPYGGAPHPLGGMYGQYSGPLPHLGYSSYQGSYPPPPPPRSMGICNTGSGTAGTKKVDGKPAKHPKAGDKRPVPMNATSGNFSTNTLVPPGSETKSKKSRKNPGSSSKKKNRSPLLTDKTQRQKAAQKIQEVNVACGGKNDKAAALAAAILRGVTMRPSGKWQAQLYFAGKSRYIGVFDTMEKAALAYEIAREKLKSGPQGPGNSANTENLVNAARKAAFAGVNESGPSNVADSSSPPSPTQSTNSL